MTHLKGKTTAQKNYVKKHIQQAKKSVVWKTYRALENAEKKAKTRKKKKR